MQKLFGLAMAALIAFVPPARAHFNMLLPRVPSAKKGEGVDFVYQWGHPFEHQLFDAPAPESLFVLLPDGRRTDLLGKLEKISVAGDGDKSVTAYRLRFVPEERGDYQFVLRTPPIWMEEEGEFFQDTVKVVLHVQAQKNWAALTGEPFELAPLSRPYGLQPGMVFQVRIHRRPSGTESVAPPLTRPVEIERYNVRPPKELPADEQVTRTAFPDGNGVVTASLMEAGWWCLTAISNGGTREHDGKARPVLERSTFWVFVDDKPAP
jgi:cobalt/nickel transport protein